MAYYFASDIHLGLNYRNQDPALRERRFVRWLRSIEDDCEGLFLVGDIFDFWFEYKRVVPKGFIRTLGQLAHMADRGIEIHFFTGNHDMWVRDYFTHQIGMKVYTQPTIFELGGTGIMVDHGDGLGKSDISYRLLSILFNSRLAHFLFSRLLHPDLAMRLGHAWSGSNRHARGSVAHTFRGETEPLVRFAHSYCTEHPELKYIICGHLHTPTIYPLNESCRLVVLGEWIVSPMIARLSNGEMELIKI